MRHGQESLLNEFDNARDELNEAYMNFQYAVDEPDIDYYIYSIKASKSKFDSIINKIKNMEDEFNK